jgi:hypothetical protein
MNRPAILVVTGASGAGKTAAVECLEMRSRPSIRCFYFDRIGVPSTDVMEREFGGPERWQAEATKLWISRLAADVHDASVCILDGQTRPSFVRAALATVDAPHVQIVLFECSPLIRSTRLVARGQPELATPRVDTWAAYLRGQADALELPVIDTTHLNVERTADALEAQVQALMAPARAAAQPPFQRRRRKRRAAERGRWADKA